MRLAILNEKPADWQIDWSIDQLSEVIEFQEFDCRPIAALLSAEVFDGGRIARPIDILYG